MDPHEDQPWSIDSVIQGKIFNRTIKTGEPFIHPEQSFWVVLKNLETNDYYITAAQSFKTAINSLSNLIIRSPGEAVGFFINTIARRSLQTALHDKRAGATWKHLSHDIISTLSQAEQKVIRIGQIITSTDNVHAASLWDSFISALNETQPKPKSPPSNDGIEF